MGSASSFAGLKDQVGGGHLGSHARICGRNHLSLMIYRLWHACLILADSWLLRNVWVDTIIGICCAKRATTVDAELDQRELICQQTIWVQRVCWLNLHRLSEHQSYWQYEQSLTHVVWRAAVTVYTCFNYPEIHRIPLALNPLGRLLCVSTSSCDP